MAGQLFVWKPTPKAPPLLMYARDGESLYDATERYEHAVNGQFDLESLKAESGVPYFDFEGRELPLAHGVASGAGPRLLLIGNLLDDLFARPKGDRILDFVDVFAALGLTPLVLPVTHDAGLSAVDIADYHEALATHVAGVLAVGGPDVAPKLYREPNTDAVDPNHARDRSELRVLTALATEPDLPVIGICRGAQLLAISRGYQLVQEIHKEVAGAVGHKDGWHEVLFPRDCWLGRTLDTTHAVVRSFHHEAVDPSSATTLRITATSSDGVVEAYESKDERLLGFQFHPELMPTTEGRLIMQGIATHVLAAAARPRSLPGHH